MPFSMSAGKNQILDWFNTNQDNLKKILDVGVGSGTYIKLIKEDNNICEKSEWVGIEVWEPYIKKYNLQDRYNKIINEDLRTLDWNKIDVVDVAIAGDVLEHISKTDAISFVDKILNKSKVLIISIPIVHMPQDAYEENPFEIHVKDDWTHEEVLDTWKGFVKNFYVKSKKSKIGVYWLSK